MCLFEFSNCFRILLLCFIDLRNVSRHYVKAWLDLQSLPTLFQRFIVIALIDERDCQIFVNTKREWVELLGLSQCLQCLIVSTQKKQLVPIPMMSGGIVWVQLDCFAVLLLRALPIPIGNGFY